MNDAFRMLFDQVKSGVIWVQRNGQVRYANRAAMEMTPVMAGRPPLDPVIERSIKTAADGLVSLPFLFEIESAENNPDEIRAVIIPAPVGSDLMVVMNNVSQERWYAVALENLIRYIAAEMASPIERLGKELARIQDGDPPTMKPDSMAKLAHELNLKMLKLQDLVAIFGQDKIQQDERIQLDDLVRQAVKDVGAVISEKNIHLAVSGMDTPDLPTVYGSHVWMSKAVGEFIEHAIHSAEAGSAIELSVQGVGTRVVIRSRNKGLFMSSRDRRNAYVPFGVGDNTQLPLPRTSIGLSLAQRIVELYGGSVQIEDEFDSVDFVLEIPAGAPAHQNAQISVEQAQRYAHDMSALMARAMKKKT